MLKLLKLVLHVIRYKTNYQTRFANYVILLNGFVASGVRFTNGSCSSRWRGAVLRLGSQYPSADRSGLQVDICRREGRSRQDHLQLCFGPFVCKGKFLLMRFSLIISGLETAFLPALIINAFILCIVPQERFASLL